MRYDRRDISSTVRAARRLVRPGRHAYVYATALGYVATTCRPPHGQAHIAIEANGSAWAVVYDHERAVRSIERFHG